MTGTELEIIPPLRSDIAGSDAEMQPMLHTIARSDDELVEVWLKSHADGSPHTLRAYRRVGLRFIDALADQNSGIRRATIDHVQDALDSLRTKADGSPASPATVNASIAAVKALLGFAHKVGYTRFNAAPLIKLKKVPRQLAKRILPVVDVHLIIRAAKPGREEVICEVAYYGTCASPRLPR